MDIYNEVIVYNGESWNIMINIVKLTNKKVNLKSQLFNYKSVIEIIA